MLLIEDEAATARTLALRDPVERSQQRFGNVSRIATASSKARRPAKNPCGTVASAA